MSMQKVKVGILGLGRAGRNMHAAELAQYPELFEIVAGCDRDPRRRVHLPDALAGARMYDAIEKELPIAPANGCRALSEMWAAVHGAIRRGKPYRVKIEEGLEVVRITEWARNASRFVPRPIPEYA